MFVKVSLKSDTCLLMSRLEKALSQSNKSITRLMRSILALFSARLTVRMVKHILRLNFEKTIWWWQFGYKEGSTPECVIKFGWEVTINSMQDDKLFQKCVGLFIIWL